MSEIKKDIMRRVYVMFFGIVAFALLVVFMLFNIQVLQKSKWNNSKYAQGSKYIEVEPVRGNVYARNGEVLATTMLYYDIRMDMKADGLTDKVFDTYVDSLCHHLADFFKDKSALEYRQELIEARKNGSRWHLIAKDVSYPKMRKVKRFPLFELGRYTSGLITEQKIVRKNPFGILAQRTVGKPANRVIGRNRPTGLEGAYDLGLRGSNGLQFCRKLPGGGWLPIDDRNTLEPVAGGDVYSTIDIELQDVAEDALYRYLNKYKADHGCVVLMETKTGAVRAIANLKVDSLGNAYEARNYAVWESAEPGSTFKLASLMAAFEDGYLDLEDKIDTENGITKFYDLVIRDSRRGGYGVVDVNEAFTVSSNTAISKWINENYKENKQRFIDRLYQFGLTQPLGLEIPGEGNPLIKPVNSWSGVTLPQMSIGYEVSLTPLQILSFYNAVANDGQLVKPRFVESYIQNGKEYKVSTEVLKESICSQETIRKAKTMLQSVVDNGTAENLKNERYTIAGKTGTTQLNYWKGKDNLGYKASFVGYFPADQPKYSCIVVVSTKSRELYYGSKVAGPIFKEVADKVYAGSVDIQRPINHPKARKQIVGDIVMHQNDLKGIQDKHGVKVKSSDATYAYINKGEAQSKNINENMPNLYGMGLRDAVFLLEKKGLKVAVYGNGKVIRQSHKPGQKVTKGTTVKIRLS